MSSKVHIEGVTISPLKQIPDDRGSVMRFVRHDDVWFKKMGEVYCSVVKKGAIKAWKKHRTLVQHMAVPMGEVQFVLFDDRKNSSTQGKVQEITCGSNQYSLIEIPAGVWYGFQGIGTATSADSLIINCIDQIHDASEMENKPAESSDIPYQWRK